MALNFKLHVNKVCFESLCISLFIRRQQNSRNVFKDNVLCTCHQLSYFSADFGVPYLNYVSIYEASKKRSNLRSK